MRYRAKVRDPGSGEKKKKKKKKKKKNEGKEKKKKEMNRKKTGRLRRIRMTVCNECW